MWVLGASLGETASLEEVASSPLVGEGMEVSGGEEVQLVVACLLVEELAACWDQKVDVQMGVAVAVPSSSQKEVVVA